MTSFSIFLSGFLVKIALFGIYKLLPLIGLLVKSITVVLALFSATLTSLLFIFQLDLKKAVAYATVQEMGQLTAALCSLNLVNTRSVSLFLITHTALSAKFFYLADILYRHFSSRSGLIVSGLLYTSPKLSLSIVMGLILFRGMPFTSKNAVEFSLVDMFFSTDTSLGLFWLITIVFIGNITFSYIFLKTLVFGTNHSTISPDLYQNEISTLTLTAAALIGFPYLLY